ncbi:hypothetical protein QBA75_41105, partial [Streptomyces stelliscabiei]
GRLPGQASGLRAADWSMLPCASEARIPLRQTSRISVRQRRTVRTSPRQHDRADRMREHVDHHGAGCPLVRIARRAARGLKGRQQVLDPGANTFLMSAG